MAKKQTLPAVKKQLSQTDVPAFSLDEALRIPRAIADNYAFAPTAPLKVAQALNLAPNSSRFRMLCGASIAYALTQGGAFADAIEVLPLARRMLRPLEEGDDLAARREAFLQPRVIGDFLKRYDGSPLPRQDIAENVISEMGVPEDKTSEVLTSILEGAESVGFLAEIKGKRYIDLSAVSGGTPAVEEVTDEEAGAHPPSGEAEPPPPLKPQSSAKVAELASRKRRVFIAHGKNTSLIEPVRKLLKFGELEAVVSTEKQTVSQPVPDKVMADLRSCGAAIIHIDDETILLTKEAQEQRVLNANVLIEIGASMALFGRRFILLVKEGVSLPSNLQGLYEVRYKGDTLDGDATIKLLEAINDIKNHALPDETTPQQ